MGIACPCLLAAFSDGLLQPFIKEKERGHERMQKKVGRRMKKKEGAVEIQCSKF